MTQPEVTWAFQICKVKIKSFKAFIFYPGLKGFVGLSYFQVPKVYFLSVHDVENRGVTDVIDGRSSRMRGLVWLRVAVSAYWSALPEHASKVRRWQFVGGEKNKYSAMFTVAQHLTFVNMPVLTPTVPSSLPETCCFLRPKFNLLERLGNWILKRWAGGRGAWIEKCARS